MEQKKKNALLAIPLIAGALIIVLAAIYLGIYHAA